MGVTKPIQKDGIRKRLSDNGWREEKSAMHTIWYKRWKNAPRCKCNDEQDGIQVIVTEYEFEKFISYSIDVTGQKPDGIWVKLEAYCIDADQICDVLDSQAKQLVAAWTLLANGTHD